MCGLCGVVASDVGADTLAAMTGRLAHRGPDGQAVHVEAGAGLGHRRLSIIDLSAAADQPFRSEDGVVRAVFNGEIYNFRELRRQLEPRHRFRSRGDGEVIVHLYEERGVEAVAALDGMFAFALWDAAAGRLLLARDRAGKKPLFYCARPGLFAFASEVKALFAHPGVPREVDPAALPAFLMYGYVPTPGTFYAGIRALPPAHYMVVTRDGPQEPVPYWSVRFRDGAAMDEREAEHGFRELVRDAVRRRLVADVPLGAFLSGGLDSATVVAFMAQEAAGRVKTFTIGFDDAGPFDEREHARTVSRHFGTEHTEFVVEPRALDLVDRLVWHHDGPFGDSSAVPTWLLAELTRRHVTVALNGDGGDEVFAGYERFYAGVVTERVPEALRPMLATLASALPEPTLSKHPLRVVRRLLQSAPRPLSERYLRWNAYFVDELPDLLGPRLREAFEGDALRRPLLHGLRGTESTLARLLQLNFETYLLDDLLVKMDRMTMGHGLEARSPFLDTRVVEFGARLPDRLRMRLGRGKLLLRRAMRGVLPPPILARGKRGFGVPLGRWFRGDLGGFVKERLLDPGSHLYAWLAREPVHRLLEEHFAGRRDAGHQIWTLLTLESWLRQEGAR